jgi:hypothetical protein
VVVVAGGGGQGVWGDGEVFDRTGGRETKNGKGASCFQFSGFGFFGTFFPDGVNFRAFFTSPRLKCSRKNVWNHLKNFLQHQEAKRSVVASFKIFLGTLGNFSIYL